MNSHNTRNATEGDDVSGTTPKYPGLVVPLAGDPSTHAAPGRLHAPERMLASSDADRVGVAAGDQGAHAAEPPAGCHEVTRCAGDGGGQGTRRVQTPAEKMREKKLREDAMALIFSPQLVQCRRCGAKIKLSLKSAWDPFHWQKHRARCLKRPDDVVMALKLENVKNGTPALVKAQKRPQLQPHRDSQRQPRAVHGPTPPPPPLSPTSATEDDSSDGPSSPTIPRRTVFTEGGMPYDWSGRLFSHSTSFWRVQPGNPPAPRCLYPRLNLNDEEDTYLDDWTVQPWRPITFQESKVRFTLS